MCGALWCWKGRSGGAAWVHQALFSLSRVTLKHASAGSDVITCSRYRTRSRAWHGHPGCPHLVAQIRCPLCPLAPQALRTVGAVCSLPVGQGQALVREQRTDREEKQSGHFRIVPATGTAVGGERAKTQGVIPKAFIVAFELHDVIAGSFPSLIRPIFRWTGTPRTHATKFRGHVKGISSFLSLILIIPMNTSMFWTSRVEGSPS